MGDIDNSKKKVALCYVRVSQSQYVESIEGGSKLDNASPERQWANILQKCEFNGWIPEKYEDVGGHRSGNIETIDPAGKHWNGDYQMKMLSH